MGRATEIARQIGWYWGSLMGDNHYRRYVEHRSPLLDLTILAKTPLALFSGTYRGATGGWLASRSRTARAR